MNAPSHGEVPHQSRTCATVGRYHEEGRQRGETMSVWVTGDVHGGIDVGRLSGRNWPEGKTLTRDDLVIVCGDFGMPWDGSNEERYWLDWLADRPWTTLFVDGNHECFPYLADLPVTQRWGGNVQVYPEWPSIIHLMRGEVYDLGGLRVFAMGGASSHDKEWRVEGWSWFPEELPSADELASAEKNLEAAGWDVDLVISHCCSSRLVPAALGAAGVRSGRDGRDRLNEWFDLLEDRLSFRDWYFGHYHADARLDDRHRLIYREIVQVA